MIDDIMSTVDIASGGCRGGLLTLILIGCGLCYLTYVSK